MYNDTRISVRGYVGGQPDIYDNEDGGQTVVFSVGVTARGWNRQENRMKDGETAWYSVRCYGNLANNVAASIEKGSPVMVRGRLVTRAWKDDSGIERSRHVIIADAVGIDLNTGTARFSRVHRDGSSGDQGTSDDKASQSSEEGEIDVTEALTAKAA
ncbi:MAG: single-stranded DNA-binding protein [Actinomycetaceae bacterium]|nr:single-stranded DNA-binding protein [Actinomycetaceae bacterium]